MLQPYILSTPPIHKLVLFDQPPCVFRFQDHGYKDQCIALSHSDQLAAGFRANIWAFLVTAQQDQDHAHTYTYNMYSIYILNTDGIR